MSILHTERLTLRPITEADFDGIHRYAACADNLVYMMWGPNSEEDTRAYIKRAMNEKHHFAVISKENGDFIGSCGIHPYDAGAEGALGWVIQRDYWKHGYGTEAGKALLAFGFDELNMRRIIAHCDTENTGSFKLMEKIGMRREGTFLEARPANKNSEKKYGDEYQYAILKDEWETQKEIVYYNALPCVFDGFIDVPELSDGVIHLYCYSKYPGNEEKKYVPAYSFAVCIAGEQIGHVSLRIGYTEGLYYGGQIGYGIDEPYRGNGYAVRACRLIIPVAKAHRMTKLLISNDHKNYASRRVCEKLGARLLRIARLPEWTELYKEGQLLENIFEWEI
jgi:RimJ/RimL family protein N-acetyltransferase